MQHDEYVSFPLASTEIRAAGTFGPYLVRVLTATDYGASALRVALWESMLSTLAAVAADGKQIMPAGSSHFVQSDRPSGVADVIVGVLPGATR